MKYSIIIPHKNVPKLLMRCLNTIPSREELLAKFLGSIQSPIANFARVIKQIAEKDGSAEEAAPAEEAAE